MWCIDIVVLSVLHIIVTVRSCFSEYICTVDNSVQMRATQVGPGSSTSSWKATLDPGKSLPCSNSGLNRGDDKSAGAGGQSGQQGSGDQKK
jgi:hypothetical protein